MRQFTYEDEKRKKKVGVTKLTLPELRNITDHESLVLPENREVYEGVKKYLTTPKKSFHGTASGELLKNRVGGSWPDGAKKIKLIERELGDAATTLGISDSRRRPVWSDQGDEVDIHRVLGGQLDTAWHTTKRNASGLKPIVSLVCSWGGNCNRKTTELIWSMASCLVAASILEGSGYSVEIIGATTLSHGDHDTVTTIKLKDADSPLEIEGLASASCFAGVWRAYGFCAIMLSQSGKIYSSLGSHIPKVTNWDTDQWDLEGEPVVMNASYTRSAAIEAVKKVLASAEE